ncbi:Hypothetical predicted protein [Cloeon dipterum]|nr:Hypothetical predicted protein [Cloeon dipterum]
MFDVTNQMGAVQTVGAYKADAINRLFYLKICTLFKGTPFNMSVSSFYALDDPVDAQLLFFNTTSDTLKKVSVQLINNSTCRDKSSQFGFLSGELTCMTSNETTNFCRDTLQDANVAATRITFSVVAIGGQVNGLFHSGTCDSQNNLYSLAPYFFYKKISSFRQTIIDLIPQVDIV